MRLFFVSGYHWSGWLHEYTIACACSWFLEWRRVDDKVLHVQVFMEAEKLEQFMDELDGENPSQFFPDLDDDGSLE